MRFKFRYLYSWGAQLSLVAANGGSSSLFGSPVVCCGGFVCSSLHVQCGRHLEYAVSGGRDFAMKTVIHFFVETVSTVEGDGERGLQSRSPASDSRLLW